ncbi:UDP-N-acetylmuramate dehydrogenase [Parendozoicomonas sp. Alg238-R29]|uniref:UDP-N-acetylmuramate dehydrogenase n=1 Tax=Parendozoicomonas sp. Alg238-R29 TaxID=2993446 RepID=UPI00248E95EB|nr:UDP-N-acetylmuramate dehydrogenase [Parendozoicomonas sp. Alg238-R29]
MLELSHHVDLKPYNTMGISCFADYLTRVSSEGELREALEWAGEKKLPVCPLGEGSNVIFSGDFQGLVIAIGIKGCEVATGEIDGQVLVKAGAGESWHEFVQWSLSQNYYGLENLSLIPGCVGAAPIQNIGAYGVEVKDVFHSLQAMDVVTGEVVTLTGEDCQFGYRNSVFKGKYRDRFIIVSVTFSLSKTFEPQLDYGQLQREVLQTAGVNPVTGQLVSDVVCRIRNSRLPAPEQLGNAGSFFKNPMVTREHYQKLLEQEPEMVAFSSGDECWKLAAGWLIDQCGFKGVAYSTGAGVYRYQALVLVNHGHADGQAILTLAGDIREAVSERFGVDLEIEPRIY